MFINPSNKNYKYVSGKEDEDEGDPSKRILFFKKKLAKLTALLGKVDGDDSDDELSFEFPLETEEQMESLEERIKDDMALQFKLVCFFYFFCLT